MLVLFKQKRALTVRCSYWFCANKSSLCHRNSMQSPIGGAETPLRFEVYSVGPKASYSWLPMRYMIFIYIYIILYNLSCRSLILSHSCLISPSFYHHFWLAIASQRPDHLPWEVWPHSHWQIHQRWGGSQGQWF